MDDRILRVVRRKHLVVKLAADFLERFVLLLGYVDLLEADLDVQRDAGATVDVLIRFGVITVRLYGGSSARFVRRRLVATTSDHGSGNDHADEMVGAFHIAQDTS